MVFVLSGCIQSNKIAQSKDDQQTKVSYIVRSIESHYEFPNANSDTELTVYLNGSDGHVKNIFCHFPPSFHFDGNMTTPQIELAKNAPSKESIPAAAMRITELRRSENDEAAMQQFAAEDDDFRLFVDYIMERFNGNSLERLKMPTWLLDNYYEQLIDEDLSEAVTKKPVLSLTGLKKIQVIAEHKEYQYESYLCEKIE
ncbi:MAG: hypothetical protein Greene041662_370 [Candidatus Peregrinibacteria bacterium Greene0416_62]|nr:MAG: hypothetical protein Greene041662_370 [Candidatus Peregrinibacteria bacterium Greene0416_62]TSC99131.1 MAG: hypothetical protein Greene101449_707 [Candidatus Peregrinibacteria bacterium Greene1014_49]